MFLTTERKVKASFTGDERRWQTNEDQTKDQISKRCTDPDDSAYDRTDESDPRTDRQKSTPIFRRRVVSDPERNGNSYDCFMDLAQK